MLKETFLTSAGVLAALGASHTALAQISDSQPLLTTSGAPAAALTTQSSTAEPSPSTTLGEIVVTAQKREQRLSDVPLSITAVTGAQLQRQGITSTDDLQRVVPGFTYTESAFGSPVFTLRGIGFYDTSIGGSPAVAVYQDQVPVPYSSEARGLAFDLERVEVLNGPQGTLFGQNSTGGAINYIAAKPTKAFTAGVDVDYGRFNEANADGFVSGSLTSDLTFRVAGRSENRDGWQQQYAANAPAGEAGGSEGARHFNEGRGLLDWKPSNRLSFELNLNGWHDGSDTQAEQYLGFLPATAETAANSNIYSRFQTLTPTPQNDRLASWIPGQDYGRDDYFYQSSLRGDYDIAKNVRFTSISSYSRYHENSLIDEAGTSILDLELRRHASIVSASEEARIAANVGPASITSGLNFEYDSTNDNLFNYLAATNSGIGPFRFDSLDEIDRQQVHTYAGFANVDYKLSHQLTITAGGRYTVQDRDFEGCGADGGDGTLAKAFAGVFHVPAVPGGCVTLAAPGSTALPPIITETLNQNNVSWKVGLNWKPEPDYLFYANATKGYKSGSFPITPAAVASQFTPVTQESVLAYEAGFKLAFLRRRASLTGAAFYDDYTNKQLQGDELVPPFGKLPSLVNIPRSHIAGGEIQAVVQPISGLQASAGLTYLDTRVDENPVNPTDPYGNAANFVGQAFPYTPKLQGVTDIEYRFSPIPDYSAYLGASTSSRSSTSAAFGGGAPFRIASYTLVDLRAGFLPEGGPWEVELWGRNVTNEYYRTNVIHGADTLVAYTGLPATYGFTLRYRYK